MKTNVNITKRKINRIIGYKNITDKQYNYVYKLLKDIKDIDKEFYYRNIGKLVLKKEFYIEAKQYFLELLDINPDSKSAYYNLYKIAVQDGDYKEAYVNLYEYQNKFNNDKPNIQLPLAMCEAYLDLDNNSKLFMNTDYTVDKTNKFNVVKIEDKQLLNEYYKVIENFNNKEFKEMSNNLHKLDELIIKNDTNIEVNTIIKINKDLRKKVLDCIYDKLKNNIEEISNDEFELLIDNLENNVLPIRSINTKNKNIQNLLHCVDKLIDVDISKSELLINVIPTENMNKQSKLIMKYLNGSIDEKNKYLELSPKQQEFYDICINKGKEAYNSHDLGTAIDYYKAGEYATNHPIFNYYMGKTFYENGNIEEAYQYFQKYESFGGRKLNKAYFYMAFCNKMMHKKKQYHKLIMKCNMINNSFDNLSKKLFNPKYPDDDKVKRKQSNKIKMVEEDFILDNDLKITDYYTYSFSDKLKIIKNLYQTGYIRMADKLLKELQKLESKTSYENQLLESENQNRLLYIRKSKYNSSSINM